MLWILKALMKIRAYFQWFGSGRRNAKQHFKYIKSIAIIFVGRPIRFGPILSANAVCWSIDVYRVSGKNGCGRFSGIKVENSSQ
jgi:hypothetical protein